MPWHSARKNLSIHFLNQCKSDAPKLIFSVKDNSVNIAISTPTSVTYCGSYSMLVRTIIGVVD